ncbi:hypothetical protein AVEN_14916-1, partial [Araneus ventricosus]
MTVEQPPSGTQDRYTPLGGTGGSRGTFGGAKRWLFQDGPHDFAPRLYDEDDTSAGTPLCKLPHHTSGRIYGFPSNHTHTKQ